MTIGSHDVQHRFSPVTRVVCAAAPAHSAWSYDLRIFEKARHAAARMVR